MSRPLPITDPSPVSGAEARNPVARAASNSGCSNARHVNTPHPNTRQVLGRAGEDAAAQWYLAHGYQVLARNWRASSGEIDLVATGDGKYIFCEVKTRSSVRYGDPAEAVGFLKQARLRRLAAQWLRAQVSHTRRPVRFDVARVLDGSVQVIEGAF